MLEDQASLQELPSSFWHERKDFPLLSLAYISTCLYFKDFDQAAAELSGSCIPPSPELYLLHARVLNSTGRGSEALQLMQTHLDESTFSRGYNYFYIELLMDNHDFPSALQHVRALLDRFGHTPEVLDHLCTLKLLQRQPGRARKAALLSRLRKPVTDPQNSSLTNQLITYEQTGHCNWLEHINARLLYGSRNPHLLANLAMQLASIESPHTRRVCEQFFELMQASHSFQTIPKYIDSSADNGVNEERLRICWLSGDIVDHPVGRFLLGFLSSDTYRTVHQHYVVGWNKSPSNPYPTYFDALPNVSFVEAKSLTASELVATVRDLNPHIAIDLSGWTAHNFGNGFLARLAPVQINYLGYYGSTGNPSVDYWLGDSALFPTPVTEWHSERIIRLSRCFIAWQPPEQLVEAHVDVTPAPVGPFRFGSFNHNRKFSDKTLSLWSAVLNAVPNSRLVLKATSPDDSLTLELLKRRLINARIDLQRIDWLPLAPTSLEHLQQYSKLDVALDCTPNGGCTTTCEALWMGVPVITLSGSTYVSRMSTSVLHGAGLEEWCANTEADYVKIALSASRNVNNLRSSRINWRTKLANSALGDASGLMKSLDQTFFKLYRQHVTSSSR